MKSISERSNGMRWLHTQCNIYFENTNFYLTIPNVVLSTINGGVTMALPSLLPDGASGKIMTTILGLVSLFSAMLITMNQYIKSQQMMEAHRAAALAYSKLYRLVSNEISLRRDQRINALDFLKHIRMEQDRLESMSPLILPHIIKKFNLLFKDRDIEKPEITGDLDPVGINIKHRNGKEYDNNDTDDDKKQPGSIFRIISGIKSIIRNKKPVPFINNSRREFNSTGDLMSRRSVSRRVGFINEDTLPNATVPVDEMITVTSRD